ncbi:MAG: hypothetical protein ABIE23_05485 [archaeon]
MEKKKKIALCIAFFLALIVFIYYYADTISLPQTEAPELKIPLYTAGGLNQEKIGEYERGYAYVPNYNSETSFDSKREATVNQEMSFGIKVEDTGILPIKGHSFHILVLNPKGELRFTFPKLKESRIKLNEKLEAWYTKDHYSNYYSDALEIEITNNKFYLPRQTLLEGKGKYVFQQGGSIYWTDQEHEIKFSFTPDEIGEWKILVFTYGSEYLDRNDRRIDQDYSSNTSKDHYINKDEFRVQVQNKTMTEAQTQQSAFDFLKLATALISALFVYFAAYELIIKKYDFLNKVWKQIIEDKYFLTALLLLILLAVLFLIFKIRICFC